MDFNQLNEQLEKSIQLLSECEVRNPKTGRMVNHQYLKKVVAKEHETFGGSSVDKLESKSRKIRKRNKK